MKKHWRLNLLTTLLWATTFLYISSPSIIYAQTKKPSKKSVKKSSKRRSFYRFNYTIQEKETFAMILKRIAKPGIRINSKNVSVRLIKKYNKHIEDWENLTAGEIIQVFIAKKEAVTKRVRYHKKLFIRQSKVKKIREAKRIGFNAFYMASIGKYTQENQTEQVFYKLDQNSPISAGLLYHFPSSQFNIMYSTSLYFSYLTPIKSNTDESFTPPVEYGVNYYAQFYLKKLMPYFGVDFETFSSFNTSNTLSAYTIEYDKHKVLYLTVGVTKTLKLLKTPVLMKLSLSPSVMTKTTSTTSTEGKNYKGFKSIFYINAKISKKFFVHSMFKYHRMSDNESLQIIRLGFGGGYIF